MAEIYERYESMPRVVISTILHEGGETDDVLQDVFMRLLFLANQRSLRKRARPRIRSRDCPWTQEKIVVPAKGRQHNSQTFSHDR